MSMTGLDVFDTTIQKTNAWLDDVMLELAWGDRHRAYTALRATLHALRDRLTVDEAAQFAAQMPMLVRGFYYEGWDPSDKPLRLRHLDEFLLYIRDQFPRAPGPNGVPEIDLNQAKDIARSIFRVLERRVSAGEIGDIRQSLPGEVRDLWVPAGARSLPT